MAKELILVGGVAHVLAVLFHVALPRLPLGQAVLKRLRPGPRGVLLLFNAHVGYALALFAAVSLFHSAELISTPLGRSLAAMIAGFWVLRAGSEFIWPTRVSRLALAVALGMAAPYAAVALGVGHPLR